MKVDAPTADSSVTHFALVHCLSLDMIHGTEFGLGLSQEAYGAWTLALPKQLARHWEALDLSDSMLKFEGDGWLVLTPETRLVKELCCLGLVMVRCFQDDMARLTGLNRANIPPLRAAITSGMDLSLSLADGRHDWAGDSARRATRACGFCDGQTVLVSESVKQVIVRDFRLRLFNCDEAEHKPKRIEEPETLYELMDLSDAVAAQMTKTSPSYVHVLSQVGRSEEGARVTASLLAAVNMASATDSPEQSAAIRGVSNLGRIDKALLGRVNLPRSVAAFNVALTAAPDYDTALEWFKRMTAAGVTPNVVTFSTLLARAPDYQSALEWFEHMAAAGVTPNVVTFSTLLARAPDYQSALEWLDRMESAGVIPNVVTFNSLLARAPDYQSALEWVERMAAAGVTPNVFTFSTLVARAPDYQSALEWFERMAAAGVTPNIVTFNTLVAQAPDYQSALEWLERMESAGVTPDVVTFNTLVAQAPDYQSALEWVERMAAAGVTQDVFTFSTLLARAPDYQSALEWFDRMGVAGVTPGVVTFSTLVARAPDYQSALGWFERMTATGVTPDVFTFSTLVARAPDYQSAMEWLERMTGAGVTATFVTFSALFSKPLAGIDPGSIVIWYLAQPHHPESPIEALLANLRRSHDMDGMTAVLIHYPHLPAARKIMRDFGDKILKKVRDTYDAAPNEPNPPYALGLCMLEQGDSKGAIPYLKHALRLAGTGPRKNHLRQILREIA